MLTRKKNLLPSSCLLSVWAICMKRKIENTKTKLRPKTDPLLDLAISFFFYFSPLCGWFLSHFFRWWSLEIKSCHIYKENLILEAKKTYDEQAKKMCIVFVLCTMRPASLYTEKKRRLNFFESKLCYLIRQNIGMSAFFFQWSRKPA